MLSFFFRQFIYILPVCVLGFLLSCEEGEILDNQPPETRIFLESIQLDGNDRLSTVVTLFWSGEDIDGFVIGFDLSLDGNNWTRVTQTDSTFRFTLQAGSDTTNINFFVRAVDNLALVDPSPAFLAIPIRNTPPTVALDEELSLLGEVLPVFSIRWDVEDIDGLETLDSVFIKLNDAPWLALPPDISFISLKAEDPSVSGSQNALIRTGFTATPYTQLLPGLNVEGNNQFYLQARDISGSLSVIDTSQVFQVQRKTSDLLVVDSHNTNSVDDILFPTILDTYGEFDYLDVNSQVPTFTEPTFRLLLEEYEIVFWYADGREREAYGERLFLDFAAPQIQQFLNQGGKLCMSSSFPASYVNGDNTNTSLVFGYSPMDSLSTAPGQARLLGGQPVSTLLPAYPTLTTSGIISSADPFYAKNPSDILYEGEFRAVSGWSGPSSLAGRTVFTNGRTNQIFFSVELHLLSGDPVAFRDLFARIFQEEFNW